jgi:hypothetical protein
LNASSYGSDTVKDNQAAFSSPEAIKAIAIYDETLRQAGPVGVKGCTTY